MYNKVRRIAAAIILGAFSLNASAIVIGVGGSGSNINTITTWLGNQGHTANIIDPSVGANFIGLNAYLSIRDGFGVGPGNSVSAAIVNNVSNFVNNGGGLVTEWRGTDIIMQMLGGTSIGNNLVGTNTTVVIGGPPHPVTNGVSSFASGQQTQFNWNTNIGGTGLTLLGTIGGQNAIMAGSFGAGNMVGLSFDWQDTPWNSVTGSGSADLNQLILNSLAFSASGSAVPEPATVALLGLGLIGIAARRRRWRMR